mmetsp:Transcript_1985/g.4594  ORF Transcript_1985/g.4594 Transcript_1985/m.4594 type:complete len:465 (-) Transcript_1985:547-1941(-)|eukprot:CAMPEP_0178992108 /NCGR_PEP_ID=MMETSP0795-20121207/5916_1 /TAXON_ID=88552 /ORGANISM="Amoebophrya sp., Strain Ameob2" /LENGTH=464 /DNA_ID=CAMNT_0020683923 /DNA_START=176 /DNA_END=1570 /DNA_ORIENTATION=-
MAVGVAAEASADSTKQIDLHENEAWAYMYLDGVTTVTFFEGDIPVQHIKDKLVQIVQASPWVAGTLAPSKGRPGESKKGKPQLFFEDPAPTEEKILESLFQEVTMNISPTMEYEQLIETMKKDVSKPHIIGGWKLMDKKLPYTKLTIAKNPNGGLKSWALIFSVSHAVADGYTYYKLLSMFNSGVEVMSFEPTRKSEFIPAMKKAVGEAEYNTVMGAPSLIVNYLSNMAFGNAPRVRAYYVDNKKIEAAKKEAKGKEVDFVSTNDILTAWWGRLTKARLLEMAVNFRGRMKSNPDLKETDAGNYEGCILFSTDDCKDPAMIRKALSRKDGRCFSVLDPPKPLPGCWGTMRCRYRVISNWASFFTELNFGGSANCKQKLHIPYQDPKEIPTELCLIFRPTKDTLGMYMVTRKLKDKEFKEGANGAEPILGDPIMSGAPEEETNPLLAGGIIGAIVETGMEELTMG